jgi:preprotein translocase subunit SecY
MINPSKIADDLKKSGGFIPGVRPGEETAEHIDSVVSRITFPGSLFLSDYCNYSSNCKIIWSK